VKWRTFVSSNKNTQRKLKRTKEMSTQTVNVKILTSFQKPELINTDVTPKNFRADDMPEIEIEHRINVSFKAVTHHEEDDFGRLYPVDCIENLTINKAAVQTFISYNNKTSITTDWQEIENPNEAFFTDFENLIIKAIEEIVFEEKEQAEYPLMPATKIAVYNPQFGAAA